MDETITHKGKYKDGITVFSRYLKRFHLVLFGVCTLSLVSAILNVSVPYLSGALLDSIILTSGGDVKESLIIRLLGGSFIFIFTIWLFLGIFDAIVSRFSGSLTRRLEISLENTYYIDFLSKLLHLPMSFHSDRKLGEILQNIHKGAGWLASLTNEIFSNILPSLLSMVAGIIIAFLISPVLGLALFFGGLIFVFSIFPLVKNSEGLQDGVWKSYSKAHEDTYDSVTHVKEVKQAAKEEEDINKITNQFNNIAAPIWIRLTHFWQNLNLFQRVVVIGVQSVLFFLGFKLVLAGGLSIGELAALNGYAALILGPFVSIGRSWQRMQSAVSYLARNESIWKIEDELYIPSVIEVPDFSKDLSFEDVYFKYGEGGNDVLSGLSFTVKNGETVALVGKSGEGKSTIVDLLGGFYFPNKGRVLVGGVETKKIELLEFRKQIAYVPQEIHLFNTSIRDNVVYGSGDMNDDAIWDVLQESGLADFVEALPKKLDTIVGEHGVKLSVGQKQRVAIARAMLRNPRILILDEPTSALDIETEKFITVSLEKLMKGRTTFIIAHRLSTVRRADKIFVIEDGKVVEEGRHDDLIKNENGTYKRLYDMHIGLHE